ncbi:PPOX class F420-dependent oxidoreductase [Phaeacidiphilus oryzae]|uniref:PPOX class F420-dependent oxidoreductase n=1 Tax=Phaeacidiphilus oryzae TaxID=348818 RepID=UPI000A6D5BF3|nr:PPOX class F420-dependent oxidoreductase [Phaeacidiphilus oryzae]
MTGLDSATLDAFTRARYVSLTTYRRDGTPVATPVWHVMADGRLYLTTAAAAWKVRRLRRDPAVKVAVCDVRGRVAPGATEAVGSGRILDAEGTARVQSLLARKYVLARLGNGWSRLTGRWNRHPVVALEIAFPAK